MQTAVNHPEYTGPATSKEDVVARIKNSDEWAIGALLRIYSFQTGEEQQCHVTRNRNDMGFNAFDAEILTSISEFYNRRQYLTTKQIGYVKKSITKYSRQLLEAGFSPVEVKKQKAQPKQETVKIAKLVDGKIIINFSFPKGDKSFFDTVNRVKSLPDRRFKKDPQPRWVVPVNFGAVTKLKEWGFDFDQDLTDWHKNINKPVVIDSNINIPGLNATLRPFQKEGVAFIESCNGRALVADEMGLGKTIQSLAYLQLHPELRPAVVVVPAAVKLNWAKEIKMFMDGNQDVYVINGFPKTKEYLEFKEHQIQQSNSSKQNNDIIIINYDILGNKLETVLVLDENGKPMLDKKGKPKKKVVEIPETGWVDFLIDLEPKVMVCDEIHYIKNPGKVRTVGVTKLGEAVKHIIGLSGTPIENRPIEFHTTLKLINEGIVPGRFAFAKKYCDAKHNGFGWDYTGASNIDELHKLLTSTIMIRRKKEDVLPELPAKVRTIVPLEIDNRAEYNKADNDIIQWIRENCGAKAAEKANQAKQLTEFEKLKQIALKGKMKACLKWIDDFLESDQKLVVFTSHIRTIDDSIKYFEKKYYKGIAVRLDGSTSPKNRQEVVDSFQNNSKVKLFFGNYKAAGVAITLTSASTTCHLELPWNPSVADQAEDRVHRIGQESESINSYYLVASNTREEVIAELIDKKRVILTKILDGKKVTKEELFFANRHVIEDLKEDMI